MRRGSAQRHGRQCAHCLRTDASRPDFRQKRRHAAHALRDDDVVRQTLASCAHPADCEKAADDGGHAVSGGRRGAAACGMHIYKQRFEAGGERTGRRSARHGPCGRRSLSAGYGHRRGKRRRARRGSWHDQNAGQLQRNSERRRSGKLSRRRAAVRYAGRAAGDQRQRRQLEVYACEPVERRGKRGSYRLHGARLGGYLRVSALPSGNARHSKADERGCQPGRDFDAGAEGGRRDSNHADGNGARRRRRGLRRVPDAHGRTDHRLRHC